MFIDYKNYLTVLICLACGACYNDGKAIEAAVPIEAQEKISLNTRMFPDWSGPWVLLGGGRVEAEETGRYPDNGRVPLTDEYSQRRITAAAEHRQSNLTKCLPAGTPGILKHLVMHEYLISSERVTMLFEDGEIRRIYTDGRDHRDLGELIDSYMGDSIGHWEGDVLIVDTIGFPNGSLWKDFGVLATINTHLVERIFINKEGKLQIDSVIDDPAIYTSPYKSTQTFQRSAWDMPEPGCAQNNRDNGETVDLVPPPESGE